MMLVSLTPITRAISAHEYHVPESIHDHIDYITPGIRLPLLKKQNGNNRKAKDSQRKRPMTTHSSTNGTGCDTQVTPNCISTLYKIPSVSGTPSTNNSLGIFEEGDQYRQTDLDGF